MNKRAEYAHYDQVKSVQIILRGEALRNARRETRKNRAAALAHGLGLVGRVKAYVKAYAESRKFKGPHFRASATNELFVSLHQHSVLVGYVNGEHSGEYVYPLGTVGRIKTTTN